MAWRLKICSRPSQGSWKHWLYIHNIIFILGYLGSSQLSVNGHLPVKRNRMELEIIKLSHNNTIDIRAVKPFHLHLQQKSCGSFFVDPDSPWGPGCRKSPSWSLQSSWGKERKILEVPKFGGHFHTPSSKTTRNRRESPVSLEPRLRKGRRPPPRGLVSLHSCFLGGMKNTQDAFNPHQDFRAFLVGNP